MVGRIVVVVGSVVVVVERVVEVVGRVVVVVGQSVVVVVVVVDPAPLLVAFPDELACRAVSGRRVVMER